MGYEHRDDSQQMDDRNDPMAVLISKHRLGIPPVYSGPWANDPAMPPWKCFFCGEILERKEDAIKHFGADKAKATACKLADHHGHLVNYIRDLEAQLDRYRAEDSDVMRSIYAMEADHRQALIRTEEEGYGRGVRDMTPKDKAAA